MRAEDWDVAIGKWHFEDDGSVWCECRATSSLLYWKHARPKDFEASVEVKFLGPESSAGIVFRERGEDFYDEATFYQFEWYARGSHHDKRLSLMRKNPYWIQIVEPKSPVAPYDTWFRLKVRAEGDHLQSFLDDELVFDTHEKSLVRDGRVGLHVFQPKKAYFRGFVITAL
ncbi:MAG: family 16 glycoside hydrolase [Polyangiales bacterium]